MRIEVNKSNRVTCVCYEGSTENSIEVRDFNFVGSHFDFKYNASGLNGFFTREPIKNENEYFVKKVYDENTDLYIEQATQEEFLQAKNNIEREMSELYRDIKAREELRISTNEHNLKMLELKDKLNYISSKIIVKL